VELRAVDGLAVLSSLPWLDGNGERFKGILTLSEIIEAILLRISERPLRYPYSMDPVKPGQGEPTLQVIGLDADSVYSTLGDNDVPTCRVVLEAVLTTMQCQLFQSYTSWSIRTLSSLLTSNQSSAILPLYADSGNTGVSTSATLSLLAPYRKVNITRPDDEEDENSLPTMLEPARWRKLWNTSIRSAWQRNGEMMRLAVNQPNTEKEHAYGVAYVFDGIIAESEISALSVSLEVYNLSAAEKTVNIGIVLCPPDYIDSFVNHDGPWTDDTASPIAILKKSEWFVVNFKDNVISQQDMISQMSSVKLTPAKRWIPYEIAVPLSQLTATTVSLSADTLSPGIGSNYRMCLIIASPSGLPPIELRNPTMSVERITDVEPTVMYSDAEVSVAGIGDISYEQKFADTWMMPVYGRSFKAPLLNVDDGTILRGLIVPSQRPLLADVAVSSMRRLRGGVMRQIEGELYAKANIDLNTRWVDRDGRYYYTNYIERLAKRGVCHVQLRELPNISMYNEVNSRVTFSNDIGDIVSLDTSALWLSSNGRSLYRYDVVMDSVALVATSLSGTYQLTLNAGQRCASVISFDGTWYTLTAYDTNGNVLSTLPKANSLLMVESGVAFRDSFVRSARFDANIKAWTLIGGNDQVTYIQTISAEGLEVGRFTTTRIEALNVEQPRLITNGYAFTTKATPTSAAHTCWWHSFAHQPYGTIEKFGENVRIVDCNESFVLLLRKGAIYELCHRKDAKLGYGDALCTYNASQYAFVGMNNALALFRRIGAYGAEVYDARTNTTSSLSAPFGLETTKLWLSGDKVCCAWIDSAMVYHIRTKTINK
jgi:hypothetical protein